MIISICSGELRASSLVRCLVRHYGNGTAKHANSIQLARHDINDILRENERSLVVNDGGIYSIEICQLSSNNPCEDQYAVAKCSTSGSYHLGVFDGHAGPGCAVAVANRLYDYMCCSLFPDASEKIVAAATEREPFHSTSDDPATSSLSLVKHLVLSATNAFSKEAHSSNIRKFLDHLDSKLSSDDGNGNGGGRRFSLRKKRKLYRTVREAFLEAFLQLDEHLSDNAYPDTKGNVCYSSMRAVLSGSCACVAHVDDAHLHLANVGDSSAVLGVLSDKGAWTARQLSRDHNFDNPEEVSRIRKSHPLKESSSVLRGGRLLGELLPLRAFGDVRYKWTRAAQDVVIRPFLDHIDGDMLPPGFDTPPYLTAAPEVFYHRLTPADKFLVIASDGLWEFITPDRAVRLLSDYLQGRQTLSPYSRALGTDVNQILADLKTRIDGKERHIVDTNGATHLIRHCLGGSSNEEKQYRRLNYYLTLPPDVVRAYRDDITVIIVHFNSDYLKKQL